MAEESRLCWSAGRSQGRCVRLRRTRQHSAAHRQAAQHKLSRMLDFNSDFDKVKRTTGKLRLHARK